MKTILACVFAAGCLIWTSLSFAEEPAKQLAGTWKVISLITKFDGGDAVEPFGPSPKGRLVLTPEGQWIIILTAANRGQAKNLEEKAALLDSMLAYSGKYTIEGNRITTQVDMSWNEVYSGANRNSDTLLQRRGRHVDYSQPGDRERGAARSKSCRHINVGT